LQIPAAEFPLPCGTAIICYYNLPQSHHHNKVKYMFLICFISSWLMVGFILSHYFFTDEKPEAYKECPYE